MQKQKLPTSILASALPILACATTLPTPNFVTADDPKGYVLFDVKDWKGPSWQLEKFITPYEMQAHLKVHLQTPDPAGERYYNGTNFPTGHNLSFGSDRHGMNFDFGCAPLALRHNYAAPLDPDIGDGAFYAISTGIHSFRLFKDSFSFSGTPQTVALNNVVVREGLVTPVVVTYHSVSENRSGDVTQYQFGVTMEAGPPFPYNDEGVPPICRALIEGDNDRAARLAQDAANANTKDSSGWTPLMWATTRGKKEIVESLISRGADVNARNSSGDTALVLAVLFKQTEIASFLLGHSADVNVRTKDGYTLLHIASEMGLSGVVDEILRQRADVHKKDALGHTPFMSAVFMGNYAIAKQLLDAGAGAEINEKYAYFGDRSAMHIAAARGCPELAKFLVGAGGDMNATDGRGDTPLCEAVASPQSHAWSYQVHLDVAGWLVLHGADVNAGKCSPLVAALLQYDLKAAELVELLLSRGADVNKRYLDETPLIRLAMTYTRPEERQRVLTIADAMMAKGADVNAKDDRGDSALSKTVRGEWTGLAEKLIAKGADVNARNLKGESTLMEAIGGGMGNVALLVARGADVNAKAKSGLTPLRFAGKRGKKEIVEFLKSHGAVE